MRILAAADIHGVREVYEWLGVAADKERADALILAGDLLAMDTPDALRADAEWIVSLLAELRRPVLYLMGNDDLRPLDYQDGWIQFVHNKRLELGGFAFVGYQYSLPFVGGIFEKPEQEIEKDLASLEPLLDAHTVFITHAPAYGVLDRTFGGEHVGSRSLARLLQSNPVLSHIHGHIHESFGRDGNRFNVASAGKCRAFLIDLPSLNHRILTAAAA